MKLVTESICLSYFLFLASLEPFFYHKPFSTIFQTPVKFQGDMQKNLVDGDISYHPYAFFLERLEK